MLSVLSLATINSAYSDVEEILGASALLLAMQNYLEVITEISATTLSKICVVFLALMAYE